MILDFLAVALYRFLSANRRRAEAVLIRRGEIAQGRKVMY